MPPRRAIVTAMSFGVLALIVLAGLGGPLLAIAGRGFVPVVIGEILAGVIVGRTGFGALDPSDPTVSFFGDVGFAMLMLTVGMHVPLRDSRLRRSVRGGALTALFVGLLAIPAGIAAAAVGGGQVAVYIVVLASGSAAVLLPAFAERQLETPAALGVMAQVTVADLATIVAVPVALQPARAGHAALGGALVAVAAGVFLAVARGLRGHRWVDGARALSRQRHWALDLRVALLVLFVLAWIAQKSGTSTLIAGFAAGLMVALVGGPKRLSRQVRGVADGFLVPLFFIVLGARLDLRALANDATTLELALVLATLNVAIHVAAALLRGQGAAAGLAACAQLGVPAAVASLGLATHVLSAGAAAAIVTAALVSLAASALGVSVLARAGPAAAGSLEQ